MKKLAGATLAAAAALAMGTAQAATVTWSSNHTFGLDDVQCAKGKIGKSCLDLANPILGTDGLTYYGIDSKYGWYVKNFDASALLPKPIDGIYDDGFVAPILDASGAVVGLNVQDPETANWKTGPILGEWVRGLGALKAKAATEHYVVMDHLFRDPIDPVPLQQGVDFNQRMKDDGKMLYYWGNYNQEPTPVYVYAKMALPDAWKVPGANFKVTRAYLTVRHLITNSPNDQIRPEDFENEKATGVLPQYTVCPTAPALAPAACAGQPAGTWVSAVDSIEGGDEEPLPAGTILRALNATSGAFEYTNAWYVTLDRDPFAGPNPRYRLKSSKYGQDLPGVELPQYEVGTYATTTIDLLTIPDAAGNPVLASSANWFAYLDEYYDPLNPTVLLDPKDGFSFTECPLTQDFDVMYYVKGEVGKPTTLYSAELVVEYDDPRAPVNTVPNDIAIASFAPPASVLPGSTNTISVFVRNNLAGTSVGTVTLTGRDRTGATIAQLDAPVVTPADQTAIAVPFQWTAPTKTVVSWRAEVKAEGDQNLYNNVALGKTEVAK